MTDHIPAETRFPELWGHGTLPAGERAVIHFGEPMTDRIEPAIPAEHWRNLAALGERGPRLALWDEFTTSERKPDMPAVIALANAALPDDDPRKITREWVTLLRFVADCSERDSIALYNEREADKDGSQAIASLRAMAAALESYLRPE